MLVLLKRSSIPLLALLLTVLSACSGGTGGASDLKVSVELAPRPARVGDAHVTVQVTDASGAPVTGATVRLEGNMNHAGMVPSFADANEAEPGRYVADLKLTMAGDWFLIVGVETAEGTKHEEVVDLPGVAAAGGG